MTKRNFDTDSYEVPAVTVNEIGYFSNIFMPMEIMQKALDAYQTKILENRSFGELVGPTPDNPTINLAQISHRVIGYRWDCDDLFISFRVTGTPQGQILQQMIDKDIPLRAYFRAVGSINKWHYTDDFELVAFNLGLDKYFEPSFTPPTSDADRIFESVKEWLGEKKP